MMDALLVVLVAVGAFAAGALAMLVIVNAFGDLR
jgi:hypothetical protein